MFDFFYNKLLKRCGRENIEVLFSDTGENILKYNYNYIKNDWMG
jgi:hypothetical protein